MDLPTVTVIVPVYNGVDLLDRCLRSLLRQTYPASLIEVIVVDNNSSEPVTAVMPNEPRFKLIFEPRRGSYAARNTGLKAARGEVIAFTDADCTPSASWLERGVAALMQPSPADMVGGRIRLTFNGSKPRTGSEVYEAVHSFKQDWYLNERKFAATANMLTWRATIDKVGVFDGSLQSRGDAEWGQRVAAASGVQRYAGDAVVDHPARARVSELLKKQLRVARGHKQVDLNRDPRPRHFLGVAAHKLVLVMKAPRAAAEVGNTTSQAGRLRYMGVFAVIQGIGSAVYLRGFQQALCKKLRSPSMGGDRVG
jgi:glycosyltransferase involved in cell wall biosynthesis